MSDRVSWAELRQGCLAEPGADESYRHTQLAYTLGGAARDRREQQAMSQSRLARIVGISQSSVARFEDGGMIPTVTVLGQVAAVLNSDLVVRFDERQPQDVGAGAGGDDRRVNDQASASAGVLGGADAEQLSEVAGEV